MNVTATMTGGPEPPRGSRDIIHLIASILPVNDMARSITLVLCMFVVLVQAPKALLSGILPIVRELRTQPCPALGVVDPGPGEAANEMDGWREIEGPRRDLERTHGRAERSERKKRLVEAYYTVLESGIFEERTAVELARDPAGYPPVVAKINRAIAAGPVGVSSELRSLLKILETFAADRYGLRDLQDYHEVKLRVLKVMRRAIESDTNP